MANGGAGERGSHVHTVSAAQRKGTASVPKNHFHFRTLYRDRLALARAMGLVQSSDDKRSCCGIGYPSHASRGALGEAIVVLAPSWKDREVIEISGTDVQIQVSEYGTEGLPQMLINLVKIVDLTGLRPDEGGTVEVQLQKPTKVDPKLVATGTITIDPVEDRGDGGSGGGGGGGGSGGGRPSVQSTVVRKRVDLDFTSLRPLYQGSLSVGFRVVRTPMRGGDVELEVVT